MPLLEVARTSKTDDATTATAVNIGKEWAIQQVGELLDFDVPCVHFFLMNDVDNVLDIIRNYNK